MLTVEDINVYYGAIHAIKGISLDVPDGEIVALIGSNGAGKSTTLRTISGLMKPKTGKILYEGHDIAGVPAHKIVGMGLCQVPEGRHVFANMTVLENLELGAYLRKDKDGIAKDMDDVFKKFPRLLERKDQLSGTLSGGEQQRIAIARVMLKNAPIIILDEATAFADPDNESRVQAAFSRLSEGKTVIMIAHRLSTVTNVDQIFVICNGQVAECGNSRELLAKDGIFSRMWKNYQTSVQWKVTKEVQ